jgi:hypothetical protein
LSLYLFDFNFRSILFKLFIQSHFDYCSSLFFKLNNKVDSDRLDRCFAKSLKCILNLNINNLSIVDQLPILKTYNLLPLKLRHLYHFFVFTFNLLTILPNCSLSTSINFYKSKIQSTRTHYQTPIATKFNSFTHSAIYFLNKFIQSKILNKNNLANFKTFCKNNIVLLFNEFSNFVYTYA